MADTTATPTQPRRISLFDIPELTAEVAQHLSFYQYTQCALVSKTFYSAFHPYLWKHFDPYLDTPFADPTLIRRNLSLIETITLSVLNHDLLPIFTNTIIAAAVSPALFFRERLPASTTEKEKEGDKAHERPLNTTLPSLAALSTSMNNLYLNNQPRLTNLTTLIFLDAGLCLTIKQHLLFHSNLLNLLLQTPNINTLHIPADLLSLHPKLFLDVLQHHLPRLENLDLETLTSKAYIYSPLSALDKVDLGLDNEDVTMVAKFSGNIDWETTVQLLETCLWKRQKNKANAFLTHLRCHYTIPDDMDAIPEPVLLSQLARLCSPSSSPAHNEDQVDEVYEPRLRYLGLPYRRGRTSYRPYFWISDYYPPKMLLPLLEELPYLARFSYSDISYIRERVLEDKIEEDNDIVAAVDDEGSNNPRRRPGRPSRGGKDVRKAKKYLGPRYRWRVRVRVRET